MPSGNGALGGGNRGLVVFMQAVSVQASPPLLCGVAVTVDWTVVPGAAGAATAIVHGKLPELVENGPTSTPWAMVL